MVALTPRILLDYLGISYSERGARLSLCCPWHDDRNPSASFYYDTNLFHCFTCALTVNMVKFYSKFTRQSIEASEAALAKIFDTSSNQQVVIEKEAFINLFRKKSEACLDKIGDVRDKLHMHEAYEKLFWEFKSGNIVQSQVIEEFRELCSDAS